MPYTTPVPGTTITAAYAIANIRDQVVTPFPTSAARDSAILSPIEGMYADLADTDSLTRYSGSAWLTVASAAAWTTFSSPLVSVSAGTYIQGSTTYSAQYTQIGKNVDYRFRVSINTGGGFGAGAGTWYIALPITASAGAMIGTGSLYILDFTTRIYPGTLVFQDTTHLFMVSSGSVNSIDSNGPGTAWATGDLIQGSITYEAA